MKLSAEEREILRSAIKARVDKMPENYNEIALLAKVHPSQVSRICRGSFKTASHNVVQICKVIGVPIDGPTVVATASDPATSMHQRRLETTLVALWDRSPKDADRLVRLLKDLQALRQG